MTAPLAKLARVINGRAYKQDELLNSGKYRVLRVGNFFSNGSWYYSDLELDEDKYCESGDLLFAWSASFGPKIWSDEKVIYHYHIWKIVEDPELIDRKFLYYFLMNSVKGMMASTHGSIMLHLTKDFMERLPVHLPKDICTQKSISDVLSSIDAKIDCNNRINEELESMAKTLYDYWFVQFDFPDSCGKPFKSSGSQMTYNEVLKREIPAHWKNSNILAIADVLGGGTPTKKNPQFWGGTIPFFTPTDAGGAIFKLSTTDYITDAGLIGSSTKLFDRYTVFITARGSVGKLVITGVEMAMNQSCYALRSKEGVSHVFLFFLAKELIHHLQVKSSGSVFDSIVSNDIELTELAIPPIDLIQQFSAIAEPLFEKIFNNTKENERLAELRDWLLPMLMNGQVTAS